MTRDDMMKLTWRAYQEVYYRHPRMEFDQRCLLVSIDFDEETMTLQPLYGEKYFNKDFIAGIQFCSIPKKKMEAVALNSKPTAAKKYPPMFEGSSLHLNPYIKYEDLDDDPKVS